MRSFIVKACAVAIVATSLSVSAEDKRPEVGPYVQAYQGDFNSSVYVVRLGARENAEALLLLSGIDHEMDGKVLKARIVNNGENQRSFMVKEGDSDKEIMRLEGGRGHLFVSSFPFGPNRYGVGYSSDLSRDANAEHILTRWLGQEAN